MQTLDRTNAASYFGALRVFVEQCRRLGVSLDSDFAYGYQSANNYGGYTAPLPRGWEKRADAVTGKTFISITTLGPQHGFIHAQTNLGRDLI